MINIQRLIKVTVAWTSIAYVVCFLGVIMFPAVRSGFMTITFMTNSIENVLTFGTFFVGLMIWNIIDVLAVALFAWLWNTIKN